MPFGFAVEPDEYRMYSGCSASSCSGSHSSSAASSASWYQMSRPSFISQSAFVFCTTKMCSSESRSAIASSTCCLTGAVLPLRRAPSTVTSALAFETSMRSLTDSTLKPPNTTLCGAPMRAHASIATTTSGIIGRKIPTTSPFSIPLSFSAVANFLTSRRRSAYVTSSSSPSSPRQWNATRSPLPASTWRSRQLWETLSLPSENHLKNGGFESSSASVGSLKQSSSSVAWFSHHAGGAFSASSCIDRSVTRASLTKSSGGSKRSCSSRSPSSRSRVPSSVAIGASLSSGRGQLARQRAHRQDYPPERRIRHARKGRIPRGGRGRQPEPAAELRDAGGATGVADAERDERDRQQDEDERDRRRRAQRRDEHVGGEDAPGDEVQADRVAGVGLRDLRGVELDEGPERQPERAVGRERDGAERVAGAELPHAGQDLRQAAVGEGEAEDDRLALVGDEAGVEHAEHERRERERRQPEGAGVGDRRRDERDGLTGAGAGRGVGLGAVVGADGAPLGDGRGFHLHSSLDAGTRERARGTGCPL